jgi:hypothetical protein
VGLRSRRVCAGLCARVSVQGRSRASAVCVGVVWCGPSTRRTEHLNLRTSMRSAVHPLGLGGTGLPSRSSTESATSMS